MCKYTLMNYCVNMEGLNSDGQQFNLYQQNEQLLLFIFVILNAKLVIHEISNSMNGH